jgi:hypothetical protein
MDRPTRRLLVAATGVVVLLSLPATAAADCNGPACGPAEVVEGISIVWTIAIVAVFVGVMVAAELRRR